MFRTLPKQEAMDILIVYRLYILFVLLFMVGCDSKLNCPSSQQCERHGACINDGPHRCVTGCESFCKSEGLCTPDYSSGTLNCVAKFNDCVETKVCLDFGRCSARNGYCIPTSDEQCRQSMECGVAGRCKVINNECMPKSDIDCINSWNCKFSHKCFFKPGRRSYCAYSGDL